MPSMISPSSLLLRLATTAAKLLLNESRQLLHITIGAIRQMSSRDHILIFADIISGSAVDQRQGHIDILERLIAKRIIKRHHSL